MWRDALEVRGTFSEAECEALHHLAANSEAQNALEVGHWLGRSTIVLLESLPADCSLTTVDHHKGDPWIPGSEESEFRANIDPYLGERPEFTFVNGDMLKAPYEGPYDFVFYDADHRQSGFSVWWELIREHLAPECVLCFDDADWPEQAMLHDLAYSDGFRSVRTREFWRDPMNDKGHADTYTLEVMRRCGA